MRSVLGEFFVKTNQAAPNDRLRFSNEAYQVNGDPGLFEVVGGRQQGHLGHLFGCG